MCYVSSHSKVGENFCSLLHRVNFVFTFETDVMESILFINCSVRRASFMIRRVSLHQLGDVILEGLSYEIFIAAINVGKWCKLSGF